MNKLETDWGKVLEALGGVVLFERITLKIADDCRYTPDFFTLDEIGVPTFYEVKGFMRDDARVKLKVAADRFPWFRFILVTRKGGVWQQEEIEPI